MLVGRLVDREIQGRSAKGARRTESCSTYEKQHSHSAGSKVLLLYSLRERQADLVWLTFFVTPYFESEYSGVPSLETSFKPHRGRSLESSKREKGLQPCNSSPRLRLDLFKRY